MLFLGRYNRPGSSFIVINEEEWNLLHKNESKIFIMNNTYKRNPLYNFINTKYK